jgi:hypothetical protein
MISNHVSKHEWMAVMAAQSLYVVLSSSTVSRG